MFGLSVWELVIILVIVMLVFGAGRLPELGRGLGQGIRSFKDAIKGDHDKIEDKKDQPPEAKV